jgi:hypothetical protein
MSAENQWYLLPADLTGLQGVNHLERLLDMGDGDQRIDARALRWVDAAGAVLLRAALERFANRRAANRAWIERPEDPRTCRCFEEILGELPEAVHLYGTEPAPGRHRDVLLAAERLRDEVHAREPATTLLAAQERATGRGKVLPGAVLVEGFEELVINAIVYGRRSDVDAVAAACVTRCGDLQVAVFDTGDPDPVPESPVAWLHEHARRSEAKPGGFFGVVRSAQYPSTLTIISRGAMLRWHKERKVSQVSGGLPGYLAILEVHL